MSSTLLFTMLLCFAFSISIAVSIGSSAILGLAIFDPSRLIIAPKEMFTAIDKFPLAAIPFFILAGNLMEASGISRRLVEFAKSLVGGVQGGLPMTTVLTCMIFAAVSGSSVATTFAIGAILIPALIRHGYPTSYAAALQATSAELGVVIPPSIPMILFGVAAEVSIGDLFLAGIGPGILIGVTLMLFVHVYCRIKGWGKKDGDGRLPVLRATMDASWALLMPFIILGGIYGGVFTPTEASVVAVFYALLVGLVIHRELGLRDLLPILKKSVLSSAVIMFIIANAGLFALIITREGVPEAIGQWLAQALDSPAWFLLGINAALFVIGMFIETSAAIIVLAPILVPVAVHFGIDPVHFGIIMVVNLALGMITPPFGVNLFAACTVAQIPLERIVTHLAPFVLVVLGCLAVIAYVPPLSLGIRDAIRAAPAEVAPVVAPSGVPSQAGRSSPMPPGGAPAIGPAATDSSAPIGPAATDASPPIGPTATDSSPPIGPAPTNAAPPIGPAATDASPPIGPAATDPSPPAGARQ
jgi:tripartite ATP-independent transporter DctM subunit